MTLSSSYPSRRALLGLAAAAAGATALGGCGTVRVGAPGAWEPPEPGVDEHARQELLAANASLREAVATAADLDPSHRDELLAGSKTQREQLRTAREATAASETAGAAGSRTAAPGATTGSVPADAAEIVAALDELAARSAASAVDTSPGLARLACSHSAWQIAMAQRTGRLSGADTGTLLGDLRTELELSPSSSVPASDPPDDPLSDELPGLLEAVLDGERRGAYLSEVLAARAEGGTRDQHLAARDERRARADEVAAWIEREGREVPAAPVGYQLPSQPLTEDDAAALDLEAAAALGTLWVPVAGAAAPADRALGLHAVLAESLRAESLGAPLSPAPGLTEDDES